jgi:hypothetical protein
MMSTAIAPVSVAPVGAVVGVPPVSRLSRLRHRRYTVEEYEELVEQGRIWPEDRCELIRGMIADKMGIGDLHAACVMRLNHLFSRFAGERYLVSIQNPILLADSVPEPDCALISFRKDFYAKGKPRTSDVLLIVEVADSSLQYDREVKRPLYAEAGIAEFWIANVVDSCVEVYRQPRPDGTYAEPRIARRGEQIALLALPDLVVQVDEVLGPAATSA